MKYNRSVLFTLLLLVVVAALYRVIPNRPFGFAPQLAMALFAGATIQDKKLALVVPVLSMFISDLLYQLLYINHLSAIPGFYAGQWINYVLFASVTFWGFLIKKPGVQNIFILSLIAPTYYFIISNFLTWAGVGEFVEYPKTLTGLVTCYVAALPFYKMSLVATLLFSGLLFGSSYLAGRKEVKTIAA